MKFKKIFLNIVNNLRGLSKKLPRVSNKSLRILAVLIFAGALGYFGRPLIFAAKVNGHFVTRYKLISELEKQGGADVLDSLVTRALILQEGKKKGIGVSQEELDSEIKRIEEAISAQGSSLDEALALQGQSRQDLVEQIRLQRTVEKILADKMVVTEDEVKKYYEDNKDFYGADSKYEDVSEQVKNQLSQEKLSTAYQAWIAEVKQAANINYFVDFK
jgi:parvulin-like peptidyl-prolyl isomerase